MNKNIIIGGLVTALVLVLGYVAFTTNPALHITRIDPNATSMSPMGASSASPNSQATPNTPAPVRSVTAPSVQTNIEAVISNSTALVSGKITPNGAQTSYWFDYGPTTDLANHTSKQSVGAGYTPISAPVNIIGLRANTQYYFRLSAQNSVGTTQGEVRSFTTNSNPAVPGKAPTVQTSSASSVARSSVNLNGKVTTNGNETTWWFEYGEKTTLGNVTTFGYIGGNQISTSVMASVSGLKPLTKYYYRINAQSQFGTVNGSIVSFTTPGPANPNVPIIKTNGATNISTSSVTMNGQLNPNGANTTYWFEYSDDTLVGGIVGATTPAQFMNGAEAAIGIKADVTGLRRNTKYYYRMIAQNEFGIVVGAVVSFRTR